MPGGAGGLVQGEPWARCEILDRAPFPSMPQFPVCVPAVQGGLLDLKSMIEKVTGKNALTNYGFYGCYCGWGGQGTPKDGTDRVSLVTQAGVQWCDLSSLHPRPSVLRCCWVHDHCYGRLEEKGCNIRIQSYKYRFAWGLVTCDSVLAPVGTLS
ncbi:phospholipase A2 group V isoform X4 [Chlorocebus sabaeus]|uniref:phospholipase A2 group V isoform X4 n=1 Tax=Chlorocebus sabaeus TaxID=60711 RepID=UPI003BF98D7B